MDRQTPIPIFVVVVAFVETVLSYIPRFFVFFYFIAAFVLSSVYNIYDKLWYFPVGSFLLYFERSKKAENKIIDVEISISLHEAMAQGRFVLLEMIRTSMKTKHSYSDRVLPSSPKPVFHLTLNKISVELINEISKWQNGKQLPTKQKYFLKMSTSIPNTRFVTLYPHIKELCSNWDAKCFRICPIRVERLKYRKRDYLDVTVKYARADCTCHIL